MPPLPTTDGSLIETLHTRLRDPSITASFEKRLRLHRRPKDTATLALGRGSTSRSSSCDSRCCPLPNHAVRWTLLHLATSAGHATRRVPNGTPTKNYLELRIEQNKAFANRQHSTCLRTLSECTALFNGEVSEEGAVADETKKKKAEEEEGEQSKKKNVIVLLKELRSHLDKGLAACPDHGGLLHVEKEYQRWMKMIMNGGKKMIGVNATIESKVDNAAAADAKGSAGFGGVGVTGRDTNANNADPTLGGGRWIRGAMRDAIAERSFLQEKSSGTIDGGGNRQGNTTTQEGNVVLPTSNSDESKKAMNPLLVLTTLSQEGIGVRRREGDEEQGRYNDDGRRHHRNRSGDRYRRRDHDHDRRHHNGGSHRRRDHSDRSHYILPLDDEESYHHDYREHYRRRENELEAEYGKHRNQRDDRRSSISRYIDVTNDRLHRAASDDEDNYEVEDDKGDDDDHEGRHAHRLKRDRRHRRSSDRRRHRTNRKSLRTQRGEEEGVDDIENKNDGRNERPLHHHNPIPVKDGGEATKEVNEEQYDKEDCHGGSHRRDRSLRSPSNDDSDLCHDYRRRDKRRKSGDEQRNKKRRHRSKSQEDGGDNSDHNNDDDARKKLKEESKDYGGEIRIDDRTRNKDERRHHHRRSSRRCRDGHRSSSRRNRDTDRKPRERSKSHNGESDNVDDVNTHDDRKDAMKDAQKDAQIPLTQSTHVEDGGDDKIDEGKHNQEDDHRGGHHHRSRSSRHKHHRHHRVSRERRRHDKRRHKNHHSKEKGDEHESQENGNQRGSQDDGSDQDQK